MADQARVENYDLPAESKLILMRGYFDAIRQRSKSYVPFDAKTRTGGYYASEWSELTAGLCADNPTSICAVLTVALVSGHVDFHDWAVRVLQHHGTDEDKATYGEYVPDPSEKDEEAGDEAPEDADRSLPA